MNQRMRSFYVIPFEWIVKILNKFCFRLLSICFDWNKVLWIMNIGAEKLHSKNGKMCNLLWYMIKNTNDKINFTTRWHQTGCFLFLLNNSIKYNVQTYVRTTCHIHTLCDKPQTEYFRLWIFCCFVGFQKWNEKKTLSTFKRM